MNGEKETVVKKETPEGSVKKTVSGKKAEKQNNMMYIGPDIAGVVKRSTVFKDGNLPEKVKKCVADYPMMERLLVDLDRMPGALAELRKKHSALASIYARVSEHYAQKNGR